MYYIIPRKILIINLAMSDLLTASTIPLTAMDALLLHWALADESLIMCRSGLSLSEVISERERHQPNNSVIGNYCHNKLRIFLSSKKIDFKLINYLVVYDKQKILFSDWSSVCPVWVSTCPPSQSLQLLLTGTESSVNLPLDRLVLICT